MPLVPDQPDGLDHTSHLYEDKLLRELRIERLKSPRAFSQQPPTRSHHLLQTPTVEPPTGAANEHLVRTVFHYTESQGDEMQHLRRHLLAPPVVEAARCACRQKRVNLLNSDAALPAVQLFI